MQTSETINTGGVPPPLARGPQTEQFSAAFVPSTWSDTALTVECVFYSGAVIPRYDFWTGDEYDLVLSLDPDAINLDRLNAGAPVCDSHNTYGPVGAQLGVVERAWVENGSGKATLRFSPRPELESLRNDIKAGILCHVSLGAWIKQKNETTAKGAPRKQFTAIDWEPFEISLVSVPADPGAVLMSAAGASPHNTAAAAPAVARAASPKETQMEPILQTGEVARTAEDLTALRTEAVNAERLRVSEIRKAVLAVRLGEAFAASLIDRGVNLAEARTAILEQLATASAAEPVTIAANVTVTRDAGDTVRNNMAAALLHRFDARAYPIAGDAGREYTGLNLMELGRVCLNARGNPMIGRPRDEVALAALTTSDFPNILANVANKTLRQGYQAAPRTFTAFCRQVTANDFKPVNRAQLSDLAALQLLNEQGEYHRTAPTDSKQTYSLATYGEVVAITRKTIINDDLNAFSRIPYQLGVAAATLESNTVWTVITGNQVMGEDSKVLFIADHSNLNTGAGSALGVAGLGAGKAAMRKQTGPKGTFLNLTPSFLIVPTALEMTAAQLIAPLNLVATTAVANVVPEWVRSLIPIVEPRLDAQSTAYWYLATTPGLVDTIEFCYLEGQDGVYIESRQGFDVDGFEIKARLDFAAAAIDYRGLQRNNGA